MINTAKDRLFIKLNASSPSSSFMLVFLSLAIGGVLGKVKLYKPKTKEETEAIRMGILEASSTPEG